MTVRVLNAMQALELEGKEYKPGVYFAPRLDGHSPANMVLSEEQVEGCTNPDVSWVKDLPQIEWLAPIEELP